MIRVFSQGIAFDAIKSNKSHGFTCRFDPPVGEFVDSEGCSDSQGRVVSNLQLWDESVEKKPYKSKSQCSTSKEASKQANKQTNKQTLGNSMLVVSDNIIINNSCNEFLLYAHIVPKTHLKTVILDDHVRVESTCGWLSLPTGNLT